MLKTIAEINEKIKKGKAVVVTAEEVIDFAKKKGISKAAQEIDVVTTGTFSPMCGSGAFLNVGHSKPRTKLGGGRVYLNDVPVYTGIAAVDIFLGATALPEDDPSPLAAGYAHIGITSLAGSIDHATHHGYLYGLLYLLQLFFHSFS